MIFCWTVVGIACFLLRGVGVLAVGALRDIPKEMMGLEAQRATVFIVMVLAIQSGNNKRRNRKKDTGHQGMDDL